jgi:hypothetical protein
MIKSKTSRRKTNKTSRRKTNKTSRRKTNKTSRRKTNKTSRRSKRSKKGGDRMRDLAAIKTKNNEILATAQEIAENNADQGIADDISFIVSEAKDESQIISQLINAELADEENVPLMQQTINISGFSGTVAELLNKIKEKLRELKEKVGLSHEEDIVKLTQLSEGITEEKHSIENIKRILGSTQVNFGGKSKKSKSKT